MLLAHGFLMDQSMFSHQAEVLAPGFRVVTWDQRGFGETRWDRKPFTYWDSADDALALLDHLGVERAILGGMSQGGFVSLRAALRAPQRVAGLVLMSTQAGVDPPEVIAGYRRMLETWLTLGPIEPLLSTLAELILGADRRRWEPWVSMWRAMPKGDLKEPATCLLERDDITSRIGEIVAPSVVFHGTADHAIPLERAKVLASTLGDCRRLVEIPGAGHAANLTHPEHVNAPLVDLCRSMAGARFA